ncbi:PREDICTED: uncharacterized protein LOC105954542 [Erythranthe guttata]|uniref:uncharacterized protein LOC105954542 n=1 Tax=Erythranthe guttata TaxID=4155 RepID=UPI00064DE0D2|nr:PREDICTED: uncharacterized protein LOC105954542 [Erythranthe guttata]|eukprot:XP_012833667.1 PREDICTED: uncharacterized protein LOC105954542 [Erythranthe guttata]
MASTELSSLFRSDEVDDLIAEGETTGGDTIATGAPDINSPVSREEVEPKNIAEALKDEFWINGMHEELNQFIRNDVWYQANPKVTHLKVVKRIIRIWAYKYLASISKIHPQKSKAQEAIFPFLYCTLASPPINPLPVVGDVHNDAAAPEPADPNLAIIVHPVNLEAMPISFIEPDDELNPIDPYNFQNQGPSSTAERFPTRRSKRMNPFPDLNATGSQRRRGGNSPSRGGRVGRRGGRGGRTPVRQNPPRGLHLVDEETDDEEGDHTFAEPEAQALSSSSTESSSKDSTPPASNQGETLQPNMAAASSQHPFSEDVAAHVPENAAAPTVSGNAPQSAAEDTAPNVDEEMPDFSGMSSAEHVDIPTVDAQDFTTTEETPSAPHEDPLETLAEAAVQVDASPSQVEEEEKSDDIWEVPLASFRKNLPSSESDSDSSEDSSQMEEDVVPPVTSPEPAYIPDDLEDSEEEEPSEDEELDLDGKDLSTPFEVKIILVLKVLLLMLTTPLTSLFLFLEIFC